MAAEPELNNEQKAAAFCTVNAVVGAGAGSGKTLVLANRYAWLITDKNLRINEILCLTFTNKAAVQMYQRIHEKLCEVSGKETGEKQERAQEALNNFVHAKIQTLDSYCASLVRQCASRYGIAPDFTIDQERCSSLADELALPFLISHCTNPIIQRLYSEKKPTDITGSIFSPILINYSYIERGPELLDDIKKQFNIICAEWKKACANINENWEKLVHFISEDETLLPELSALTKYKKNELEFPPEEQIKKYFDQLSGLPPDECISFAEKDPLQNSIAGVLKFLGELAGLNLKKGRKNNNPAKDLIKEFFRPVFGEFSSLAVFCMQAGFLISLMALMQELQKEYLNKKRAESILSFSDVARLARAILLEQPDIRKGEKETYKAIMIDEFQDNNELQKDLLFLLAENTLIENKKIPAAKDLNTDKLFFVGDEKQSIYLFRGADVSVFKKLKNELQCKELPLAVNYRSSPELIGAFNAIFGGSVFDPAGKAALAEYPSVFIPESASASTLIPLYEAAYTPLKAGKTHKGKLAICIFDKSTDLSGSGKDTNEFIRSSVLSPVENEACFIAERIKQMLDLKTSDGKNEYKPEDIAILFRTRTFQHLYEKHLRRLNIPYACENMSNFFFGGPVNDLMSVLRLVAYPLDKAAYAQMLRSPFAGISLAGLAICLAQFNKPGQQGPFTDEPLSHLSESDKYKYRQGQNIYRFMCDKACYESTSTLVSELWYRLGYRYETEWNPHTRVYCELYDYLFHLAVLADAENQGLAAFTGLIQAKRDNEESITDIEIPLERPGAVRLMTIHKSKGLEFPVVFLPLADKHSKPDQCGNVFDTENAGTAISPPLPQKISGTDGIRKNYFWEKFNTETKLKRTAELRRLLYVGMTRAEKELYISGSLDIRKYGQNSNEPTNNFLLLLKNYVESKTGTAAQKYDENTTPADSIIANDTFFGLCLPALASHIPPSGFAAEPSFFTLEEIPVYTGEDVHTTNLPNNYRGLQTFIKNAEQFYAEAEEIPVPVVSKNTVTPTSLKEKILRKSIAAPETFRTADETTEFLIDREFSGEDALDVFDTVDSLLKKYAAPDADEGGKFTASDFGTIAHACVEALLKGKIPVLPLNPSGFLTPKESSVFLDAGKELALRFLRSPLGKIALKAEKRENEYPFRTLLLDTDGNETFINGKIDLLFEDSQSVYVVDFKTDYRENPEEHTTQMVCYYRAAKELRANPENKDLKIWLYYLRSGHAFKMV